MQKFKIVQESNYPGIKDQTHWTHPHTGASIQWSPNLQSVLKNVVEQQTNGIAMNPQEAVLQSLAIEMEMLGFIAKSDSTEPAYPLNSNISTLFNLPVGNIYQIPRDTDFGFLSVPSDQGGKVAGARHGGAWLRSQSKHYSFRGDSSKSVTAMSTMTPVFEKTRAADFGEIRIGNGDFSKIGSKIKQTTQQLSQHCIPFLLGGDHSFTYFAIEGLVQARKNKPFTLLHIDAHLDRSQNEREPGSLNHANFISHIEKKYPQVKIIHVGIKEFQSWRNQEKSWVGFTDFNYLTQPDESVAKLPTQEDVYVSIDVDAIGAPEIESTGYPSSIGLSCRDLLRILQYILSNNRLIGVDIMEFSGKSKLSYDWDCEADRIVQIILWIQSIYGALKK